MGAELGCKSPLVLAKLGYDLRAELEGTFEAPLPDPIQRLADEVDGYAEWSDVVPAPRQADDAHRTDDPREAATQEDEPFRLA